jgi:hypothetical protein
MAVDFVEVLKNGGQVPVQGCGEFRDISARSSHLSQCHGRDSGKRQQGSCSQCNADLPRHGQRPPRWDPPIAWIDQGLGF